MSEILAGIQPVTEAFGPPLIELAGVEKVYRTGKVSYRALRGVDLTIEAGDMVAIVGHSGSGKSTIMNMITGIDRPTAGTITVDGRRIDLMSEEELAVWRGERVGVVFQFFQLLPTLTALENAMLPLDFSRRVPRRERAPLALHNLELVGLEDRGDSLPAELSGGQQQRVGIARSLSTNPSLWLLDEPFSALDPLIREEMQDEILRLQITLSKTAVFVTHDFNEAARVGDRIALLRKGELVQTGSAAELILNPADSYVRAFTASAERSRILTAENFMQRGEPDAFDVQLEAEATLRRVAETFQGWASVIAFGNSTGRTVGFMRRQDLGDALTSAMTA